MSAKVVTDRIGQIIEQGAWIVYGRSQGDDIHFGHVAATYPETNEIKVTNDKTGRASVNKRRGVEVLVISYLKDLFPEHFI